MSFDTTFDYTDIIGKITTKKGNCTSLVAFYNNKLTELAGAVGFASIVAAQTAITTIQRDNAQVSEDNCNGALSAIAGVTSLGSGDKQTLYDFYAFADRGLQAYMCIIASNYAAMLVDTNVTDLNSDGTNPLNVKVIIGSGIMSGYKATIFP